MRTCRTIYHYVAKQRFWPQIMGFILPKITPEGFSPMRLFSLLRAANADHAEWDRKFLLPGVVTEGHSGKTQLIIHSVPEDRTPFWLNHLTDMLRKRQAPTSAEATDVAAVSVTPDPPGCLRTLACDNVKMVADGVR